MERSLGEFLQEQGDATSSLGKAAEYFLAWVSRNRERSDKQY